MLRAHRRKAENARLRFGLNDGIIVTLSKAQGLGTVTQARGILRESHHGAPWHH
jgi:hypothetical protein